MGHNFQNANIGTVKQLAEFIAKELKVGDVVFLHGPLGVGKTTFARMMINYLQKEPTNVTSPTFNIVHQYETKSGIILWHFDLYRIKMKEELEYLGISEATLSGISIVEWPEIIENECYWANDMVVDINISFAQQVKSGGKSAAHQRRNYAYLRNITTKDMRYDTKNFIK